MPSRQQKRIAEEEQNRKTLFDHNSIDDQKQFKSILGNYKGIAREHLVGLEIRMDLKAQVLENFVVASYNCTVDCPNLNSKETILIKTFINLTEGNNGSLMNSLEVDASFSSVQSTYPQMSLILFSVIFAVLAWYHLKVWWKKRHDRLAQDPDSKLSHLPLPPGEYGPPIIGETFAWLTQGSQFNATRRKKYGNVFKTNTIGQPMVRVTGHEYVKEVLKGEHDKVTTIWPINVRKILGENVLVNSLGAIHRHKRKITSKALTNESLKRYIPQFQLHITRNIKAMAGCERPLVYDKMLRLTFDVAAGALLGLDPERSDGQRVITAFYNLVSNIFCIPLKIPGLGFSTAMKARAEILELLQEHIQEKKKSILKHVQESRLNGDVMKKDQKSAFDIIIYDMFTEALKKKHPNDDVVSNGNVIGNGDVKEANKDDVEEPEEISDFALKEMAMELMFAGYFTSGSALTSAILELACHPEVFRKLEDELLEHGLLKDSENDEDVEVTLDLLHKLTYLEQVLKETLRVRPPVLGGYRKARRTFQLGDYRVPKGWTVIYNIRDTHDFEYDGMEEFRPERFDPKNNTDDKFRFIPFGGGPRTCIGREFARNVMKMTLIEMFRQFQKWELANKKLPKMKAIPTLHPADGLPCNMYLREQYGVVKR